jgi:hypothetical protein
VPVPNEMVPVPNEMVPALARPSGDGSRVQAGTAALGTAALGTAALGTLGQGPRGTCMIRWIPSTNIKWSGDSMDSTTRVTFTPSLAGHVTVSILSNYKGVEKNRDSCQLTVKAKPTLTVEIVGNGSVASTPFGITCPTTCTATFDGDADVTLKATPDATSELKSFGGDCSQGATADSASVKMDGDKKCRVTFGAKSLGAQINVDKTSPVAPLEVVTLSVDKSDSDYCIKWYRGGSSDRTLLDESGSSLQYRVTSTATFQVEVLDKPCSSVLASASQTVTMIKPELFVRLSGTTGQHVKVNQSTTTKAQAFDGSNYVWVTDMYTPKQMLWLVVRDGNIPAIRTETSGVSLSHRFAEAGNYWVHFMLQQDGTDKYATGNSFYQVSK